MRNALVIGFLILCIASSNFSIGRGLTTFNVLDYGALGDGKTDDSKHGMFHAYKRKGYHQHLKYQRIKHSFYNLPNSQALANLALSMSRFWEKLWHLAIWMHGKSAAANHG
ncbi:hypothetical protein TB2_046457 [Malus domestica]